jgi:hypothetical protein
VPIENDFLLVPLVVDVEFHFEMLVAHWLSAAGKEFELAFLLAFVSGAYVAVAEEVGGESAVFFGAKENFLDFNELLPWFFSATCCLFLVFL